MPTTSVFALAEHVGRDKEDAFFLALKLHPVGRTIAKAAQKYGFVVWDKAGAITLRAQNPKSYTKLGKADPYPALFKDTPAYALLDGFPWERLQFLPMDYGKP